MTIRLVKNPQTGKQQVVVKLDSEADALPHEHEQLHRQLVEQLVGKGMNIEDLGDLVIEREGESAPIAEPSKPADGGREKRATGSS